MSNAFYSSARPRVAFGYSAGDVSGLTAVHTGDETLTQQQFVEEVDINTIVKRFGITGQLPFGSGSPFYGDFRGIENFEDAVSMVDQTWDSFMKLPPEVRARFGNDPGRLVAFAQNASAEEFDSATRVEPLVAPGATGGVLPPDGGS